MRRVYMISTLLFAVLMLHAQSVIQLPATYTVSLTDVVIEESWVSESLFPGYNYQFEWTSTDPEVATVENRGELTLNGKLGTTTVTVSNSAKNYTSTSCVITVTAAAKLVETICFETPEILVNPGQTKELSIIAEPADASFKKAIYTSSNPEIVEVSRDYYGNPQFTSGLADGKVTITATTLDGSNKTATMEVEVKNPAPVTAINPEAGRDGIIELSLGDIFTPSPTIVPSDAFNKRITYVSSDPTHSIVYFYNNTIIGKAAGEVTLTGMADDGRGAKIEYHIKVVNPDHTAYGDYTKGTFFLNEDWFGHENGSINYLTEDNQLMYKVYQRENEGFSFGCTAQYGTVYGENIYVMSKQEIDKGDIYGFKGGRLVVANAKTLKKVAAFDQIGGGDGRAFVGVDPKKGYIGTTNGIFLLDLEKMELGEQIKGTGGGSLYNGQIGLMIHAGKYVFAAKQSEGTLVIDTQADTLFTTIKNAKVETLTQAADGSIFIAQGADLLRIDPVTLDTIQTITLAKEAQISAGWGSWRAGSLCADPKHNVLYWSSRNNIYRYDIDNPGDITPLFAVGELKGDDPTKTQTVYGAGCRFDVRSGDLVVTTTQSGYSTTYEKNWIHYLDGTTGKLKRTIRPKDYYWFMAMPIFPDAAPVMKAVGKIELAGKTEPVTVGIEVTDADNLDSAIKGRIKSISENKFISGATLEGNRLTIIPNAGKSGKATITLAFESNGKVIEGTVQVSSLILSDEIRLNKTGMDLYVGDSEILVASVLPENTTDKDLIWSSSDEATATVSTEGLVSAIKVGTATITVTTVDNGATASCQITVLPLSGVDQETNRTPFAYAAGNTLHIIDCQGSGYCLTNLGGQPVLSGQVNESGFAVPVDLSAGTYILKVTGQRNTMTFKVVFRQ